MIHYMHTYRLNSDWKKCFRLSQVYVFYVNFNSDSISMQCMLRNLSYEYLGCTLSHCMLIIKQVNILFPPQALSYNSLECNLEYHCLNWEIKYVASLAAVAFISTANKTWFLCIGLQGMLSKTCGLPLGNIFIK